MFEPTVLIVFLAALVTALATGLGALPFAFVRRLSDRWLSLATAAAGGIMLAASVALVVEGQALNPVRTYLGMLLGLLFIVVGNRFVNGGHPDVAELSGADARKVVLILGVMTLHSFAEGVGVGVSFGDTEQLAAFVTTAIAVHNIPEGLAISLVMVPRGASPLKAAGWSVFSSLPQPLMAVPAFLFIIVFEPLLPVGLGLAAGAMVWMVFAELVPDAMRHAGAHEVAVTVVVAVTAMLAFQTLVLGG